MDDKFSELCKDVARLANVGLLPVDTDADGVRVCEFVLEETDVELLAGPGDPPCFYSRVVFGAVPDEADGAEWGEFLEANFILLSTHGPAFARDPWTGTAVLQQRWPMDATPDAVYAGIARQCDAAREWRTGSIRAQAQADREFTNCLFNDPLPAAAHHEVSGDFDSLRSALCEALGPESVGSAMHGESGVSTLEFSAQGKAFLAMTRSGGNRSCQVLLFIENAQEWPASSARDLAEANAWLLDIDPACVICRHNLSGDYMICATVEIDTPPLAPRIAKAIRLLIAGAEGLDAGARQTLAHAPAQPNRVPN
jgi:hypothetical protein